MKYTSFKRIATIFLIAITITSCEKSENQIPANVEIQDFVWKGMNAYYFWQDQIPDLADTRFSSQSQLNSYLEGFPNPADLFQTLRFQPGVADRFSWIVDDYIALENSFQGINQSNGMEIGLVRFADTPSNLFGYVRYVIPNSDAETQGVTRGMLFTEIGGTQITEDNFNSLLSANTYTIHLADYNAGNPTTNGTTIALTKSQLQENPVHIAKVIDEGVHKIGYLLYNQFADSFDGHLNAAFATFQSEGITDLIIDLRYNGGGATKTAVYLGSMITGQFNGQLFSRALWNSKVRAAVDERFFIDNFTDEILNLDRNGAVVLQEPIHNLNLTRVYFITTGSTASASELVMNSLSTYINVASVGTTTLGKVHGSTTLYDTDTYTRNGPNLNPNHTWAMQPLVNEIVNSNGTNQPNGISPNVQLPEDYENLGVLGEKSDPLLDRTITLITTGSRVGPPTNQLQLIEFSNSKLMTPARNYMIVELKNK